VGVNAADHLPQGVEALFVDLRADHVGHIANALLTGSAAR
jgi:hypothetical protein